MAIPEDQRREFAEIVYDLLTESSGILNWLIAGALDWLANGLFVAPQVTAANDQYRERMDTIGVFFATCLRIKPGGEVPARAAYEAYKSWCMDRAERILNETRFGKEIAKEFERRDGRTGRVYLNCELHDVPTRPDERPEPCRPRSADP